MIDNYKSLCTIYYDADKPFPPLEEFFFYRSFLEKYQNNILEPMCGSGRFLIPFLQEGYIIDAFDASHLMLEVLKKRLIKNNLFCNYSYSLFKNFSFLNKYNLIYIPSASFSLIYNIIDFKNALEIIYNNLEFGGAFVFEVETPNILEKDKSDFKFISNNFISLSQNEKILGSFINHAYYDQVLTISCRYDLIKDDCIVKTEFEDITVRLFVYEEIMSLLKEIGFNVICYKNFQKEFYNQSHVLPKLLILECLKN